MNLEILFHVMYVNGITSIHLVKYFVAMMVNLCALDEAGFIFPTNSSPQYEKG
jgi:hypothetical protein